MGKNMKSANTIFLILTLVLIALVTSIGTAFGQTEILTFDDVPVGGFTGPVAGPIPNGYGGLQWNNFDAINAALHLQFYGPSGYNNGVVSPTNEAFNGNGTPAVISGQTFNLNSAYLSAAWNDGLQVEVQGFVGTTLTYDNTYTVNTQGPTLINFNYAGIDEVEFISSGGVPHGYTVGHGTQFGMDNVSVTLIPEPSTFALAGLAPIILPLWRLTRAKKLRTNSILMPALMN
jgi:hypothetical protein